MLRAGAIPLVRGNVPAAGASIHVENHVWGRAKNPYDQARSCGGSSGGDGGLVAARCVPIGFGTDIGGSIRIPSTFNGITGFKPTQGRTSIQGYKIANQSGFDPAVGHLRAGPGPMARSVRDCIGFFKVQCAQDAHKIDPFQPTVPFKQEEYDSIYGSDNKIKIGVMEECPLLPVSKSVKRAMQIAVKALEERGFEVVKFDIPKETFEFARKFFLGLVCSEMAPTLGKAVRRHAENVPASINLYIFLIHRAPMFRRFLAALMRSVGMGRQSQIVTHIAKLRQPQLEKLIEERYNRCYDFSEYWQ